MTREVDFPLDANQADVIEQLRPAIDDGDTALPDELPLVDADPVDARDQYLTVPMDDDDWRT